MARCAGPGSPWGPAGPVAPISPAGPGAPAEPAGPAGPLAPREPLRPTSKFAFCHLGQVSELHIVYNQWDYASLSSKYLSIL